MRIFKRKEKEAIVVAPKDESTGIGSTIAERIHKLAQENDIETEYVLFITYIDTPMNYSKTEIAAVLHGEFAYLLAGDMKSIPAEEVLNILKTTAEYFNTSTDYILGLTDRMY